MSDGSGRDTARYVLGLVLIVLVGVAANLIGVITGTQELIAQYATQHSLAFALALWCVIIPLLGASLYFYFRGQTLAQTLSDLSRKLADAHTKAAVLQVEMDHLRKPSAEALGQKEAIRGMVLAARDIVAGVFDPESPRFAYTRIDELTTVEPDGTATVVRDYEIEGGDEPAHVWRIRIFADSTAQEVDLLSDLDFKAFQVFEGDGQSLRYLLTENGPRKKEIILFFLPPVKPGEKRRFKILYRWPGFARDLIERRVSQFFATYTSYDSSRHASITYEMRFAKEIGSLDCQPRAVPDGGRLVVQDDLHYRVFRYENHTMPVHKGRIEFDVKLIEDQALPEAVEAQSPAFVE